MQEGAACGWVCAEIKGVIDWAISSLQGVLVEGIRWFVETGLGPIVRTPHIEGKKRWIAFQGAANEPWASLWANFYTDYIIPLALGLLFLGFAYVGLRLGTTQPSEYRRQRVIRRIPIAFFTIFFWWPLASFGTRLFDSIAVAIVDSTTLISTFEDVLLTVAGGFGGTIVTLLFLGIDIFLLFAAAFLVASRWLLIMLLTVTMPLIAVFWVFEEWPLRRFSGIARNLASLYPGLLIGGVFAAVLVRFVFELHLETTSWAIANGFLKAVIISITLPLAALTPILIAFGGNRAVQYTAIGAAASGVGAASARSDRVAQTSVKQPAVRIKNKVKNTGASGVAAASAPVRKPAKAGKRAVKTGAKTAGKKGLQKGMEKAGLDSRTVAGLKETRAYWRRRRMNSAARSTSGDSQAARSQDHTQPSQRSHQPEPDTADSHTEQ